MGIKFEPEDMSVREVDFVQSHFSIKPDIYCAIRKRIWEELYSQAKEEGSKTAREEAKKAIREELKVEITKEVMPALVEQAEKKAAVLALKKAKEELELQIRTELVSKINDSYKLELLTEEDRKAYQIALREIEVESLTLATSSSSEADSEKTKRARSSWIRHTLLASALIGLGPYALWLLTNYNWWHLSFWLMALPYFITLVYCVIRAVPEPKPEKVYGEKEKPARIEELRTFSSDYLQIVSRARLVRYLYLNTRLRRDVQEALDILIRDKTRLDEMYRPTVNLVENVKSKVRVRLTEEMDPEKLFTEEFDERLVKLHTSK